MSHKKNKSSEIDLLVGEVWLDCTQVWLDRLHWGLVGQSVLRFGWTVCSAVWLDRLYWGLVGQTVLKFGWTDCTEVWLDRLNWGLVGHTVQCIVTSESQAYIHQSEIEPAICVTIEVCYSIWGKWQKNSKIIIIIIIIIIITLYYVLYVQSGQGDCVPPARTPDNKSQSNSFLNSVDET